MKAKWIVIIILGVIAAWLLNRWAVSRGYLQGHVDGAAGNPPKTQGMPLVSKPPAGWTWDSVHKHWLNPQGQPDTPPI